MSTPSKRICTITILIKSKLFPTPYTTSITFDGITFICTIFIMSTPFNIKLFTRGKLFHWVYFLYNHSTNFTNPQTTFTIEVLVHLIKFSRGTFNATWIFIPRSPCTLIFTSYTAWVRTYTSTPWNVLVNCICVTTPSISSTKRNLVWYTKYS